MCLGSVEYFANHGFEMPWTLRLGDNDCMNKLEALSPRAWTVSALCRAVADTLDAQFNPVTVRGEISGFSRAASGHCGRLRSQGRLATGGRVDGAGGAGRAV